MGRAKIRFGNHQNRLTGPDNDIAEVELKNIIDPDTKKPIEMESEQPSFWSGQAIAETAKAPGSLISMLERESHLGQARMVSIKDESGKTVIPRIKLYPADQAEKGVEKLRFMQRQDVLKVTGSSFSGFGGQPLEEVLEKAQKKGIGLVIGNRLYVKKTDARKLEKDIAKRKTGTSESERWGAVFVERDSLASYVEAELSGKKDEATWISQQVQTTFNELFSKSLLDGAEGLLKQFRRISPDQKKPYRVSAALGEVEMALESDNPRREVDRVIRDLAKPKG